MNANEFNDCVGILKASYQREKFLADENAIAIWFGFFKNFTAEELNIAVLEYVASSKYPPTPADLIEILKGDVENNPYNTPSNAWLLVEDAMSRWTIEQTPARDYLKSKDRLAYDIVKEKMFWLAQSYKNMNEYKGQFMEIYQNRLNELKDYEKNPERVAIPDWKRKFDRQDAYQKEQEARMLGSGEEEEDMSYLNTDNKDLTHEQKEENCRKISEMLNRCYQEGLLKSI